MILLALLTSIAFGQEVGKQCLPCHTDQIDDLKKHKHFAKSVACEVCHGTSENHRKAVGAAPPDRVAASDEVPALCGSCHVAQRKEYATSKHGALVLARSEKKAASCTTCHGVHAPRDGVAMKRQCDRCHESLPAACKQEKPCATCHQPHTLRRN